MLYACGVVGLRRAYAEKLTTDRLAEPIWKVGAKEGDSPVSERRVGFLDEVPEYGGTSKTAGIWANHRPRLNTTW